MQIGELVREGVISIKTGPFGTQLKAAEYQKSGTPVLNVKNLGYGSVSKAKLDYVGSETVDRLRIHLLKKGDIVFGRKGAVDRHAYIDYESDGWMQGSDCIRMRIESNTINPRFLSYYFLTNKHKAFMISMCSHGTTMASLNQKILEQIEIPYPERQYQDKVVDMLERFDKKIKVNSEINENLSNQIQAIYSNTFDPTTHTPFGVLADICSYSSDRIPVSELSVSTYFSTENMQPNKIGSVDATSLPSITQTTGCHKGDVLVSNIRPYFKKIVYVKDDCCGCSTDVLCFVPKEDQYSAFLFGTLYMDCFFDYMVAGSKGTKMPRGDKQQIMNYPVVLPDKESLDLFNGLVVPMLDQIATNRVESSRLAALRDALLPKLMSGELNVSELDL